MLGLAHKQELKQTEILVIKLGLDGGYMQSCLPCSEALLGKAEYQRPLELLRKFADGDRFRSILDFLLAVFAPRILPYILSYYNGSGLPLKEQADDNTITRLDGHIAEAIRDLRALHAELQSIQWKTGRTCSCPELIITWLDFYIRPWFYSNVHLIAMRSTATAN